MANTFLPPERRSLDEKRAAALAYLGEKWILHPANKVQKCPARSVLSRSQ
jgi:hypothetical protein